MSGLPTVIYISEEEPETENRPSCISCGRNPCSAALNRSMDVLSMIKYSIIADEANPITKYFEIRGQVASCGPEMVWKIYEAVRIDDLKNLSIIIITVIVTAKLSVSLTESTSSQAFLNLFVNFGRECSIPPIAYNS
ncbi:hypothetical protein CHS0354_026757 [Potamilus streckersoni]|uniref:Uncharacterized protein n=1 Tax=Potamilus streckersoni TaxID=2493646 RepID=A0AAE0SBR9_9BIVA|nr:hypothetical protein CHS0354_026757 [Potamilus streckersoni]